MERVKTFFRKYAYIFQLVVPYGVFEPWDNLDPRLYHAVHVYWLKFYGMWYNTFSPKSVMFWLQMIYAAIVLWLVCFLPGFGEVIYLLKRRDNIGNIAEGLYLFLSEMYTYVKIAVFWKNKHRILALLDYLACEEFKPSDDEQKRILLASIKTSRLIVTAYSAMCVGAVSVGIIMPLTENLDVLPTNVEYPYIDVLKSPAYQIIYLHHIYYKPATCIIDGVMDTILAAFVTSAIAQIDILALKLRNFKKLSHKLQGKGTFKLKEDAYYEQLMLRDCIIHHNSIIRYVSMIEGAFSLASVLQFMLSAMVLCLVGVQFLSIENPAGHPVQILWTVIYLTCMLTEVFILCWFGNELICKSESLRQAAFDGPWIGAHPRTKKYIVLFMERCKRPLKVSAGKIFPLSLETYTVLINWSYKAFAVMSSMKN